MNLNFYYENHLGERIDFYNSPYVLTGHTFADWSLSYNTVNNRSFGFKIKPVAMTFTVTIMPRAVDPEGREARYAHCIDSFVEIVSKDKDVNGKLWSTTGEYLNCQIVASKKTNWRKHRLVTLSCTLQTDYPYWIKERKYSYSAIDNTPNLCLDYPYGYNYDFGGTVVGVSELAEEGTDPAGYKLIIYGRTSSPRVRLNGIWRGATVDLYDGERLEIDSINKTVLKITETDTYNVFASRLKGDTSIFDKIAPGQTEIMWNGKFDFDLIMCEERREPRWS